MQRTILVAAAIMAAILVVPPVSAASGYRLIGWNDLGMHCMDGDYSIYAILPPYNTIHAQLIDPNGKLVRDTTGITVTYKAIADPSGSINTSSAKKTNFWQYVQQIFGVSPAPDVGLTGNAMPTPTNRPHAMKFDAARNWYTADAIPITPFDDSGNRNYYPLMHLMARDPSGALLAQTDIVLPVSDEMSCKTCHASRSGPAAQPVAGWAWNAVVERDYKLNILRLHDEKQSGLGAWTAALRAMGYNPAGLSATAAGGRPILCGSCHASNALGTSGQPGAPALTSSIHAYHSHVIDPANNMSLGDSTYRSACYRCHPGSATKCLRGVMGNAVAADGSPAIQCQSCHGPMARVGERTRRGWLDEPSCQNCHTGTAVKNAGSIRFTNVFNGSGPRIPADSSFATNSNVPVAGASLYRYSTGHAGLFCEACHGSTHAEFASSHVNDNLQSIAKQKYAGTLAECNACHASMPNNLKGPHGMHPIGQRWVDAHEDVAENGTAVCKNCHGSDLRGTVLSQAFTARTLTSEFGTLKLYRGFQVGCYACHSSPGSLTATENLAPVASSASLQAMSGYTASVRLQASDPLGTPVQLRIVQQPQHGTVIIAGNTATLHADANYEGDDAFTYTATDGMVDSNQAIVAVHSTATPAIHPQLDVAGVKNAASYETGVVSPGMLVAVFGTNLGSGNPVSLQINSAGMAERFLGNTRVLFDGLPAPLTYASANQVNAVVPFAVAGHASTILQVENYGILSDPIVVPVATYSPGIFSLDGTGAGPAAALNYDAQTQRYVLNAASHPVPRGGILVLYATGGGSFINAVWDGLIASEADDLEGEDDLDVLIAGKEADILYAGAAPTLVAGVMQINVRVPAAIEPGDAVPIQLSIGGSVAAGYTTVAVK